jgi:hypothetical protein
MKKLSNNQPVMAQFECGTRILRVIHGRDARATSANCTSPPQISTPTGSLSQFLVLFCDLFGVRFVYIDVPVA